MKWIEKIKFPFVILLFGLYMGISNGVAVMKTTRWDADHLTALVLGNLVLIFTLLVFWLLYRLGGKLGFGRSDFKGVKSRVSQQLLTHYYWWSFGILGLLMVIVPLFFMIHVPDAGHDWDFFIIFNATSKLHGQSFAHLPMTTNALGYFLRYPNNQLFSILFNQTFAGLTEISLKIFVVTLVSSVLTSLALLASSLLVRILADCRLAVLFNCCAAAFLPFYLYGAQLYTDTLTLPFVCLGLLCFVWAFKALSVLTKLLGFSLSVTFLLIGFTFKPTVLIVLIAELIFLLVNKKWKAFGVVLALFGVLVVAKDFGVKAIVSSDPVFSQENKERYSLPVMHWIAMSWAPENKTGGFKKAIRLYTEQFDTYQKKQIATKQLFLNNLKKMGVLGVFRQIGRKLIYTWAYPDLNGLFYSLNHENPLIHRYFDYSPQTKVGNVTGFIFLKMACFPYWAMVVWFMWRLIFKMMFHKYYWQQLWFILAVSVFGCTIFLILWEANSRYLYNFSPLMLALALYGYTNRSKKENKNESDTLYGHSMF